MVRCEDCLHFEVCQALEQGNGLMKVHPIHCGCYKPTADVIEVVRCKDCQFAKFNTSADVYKCDRRGHFMETVAECDFCSKGKRREQT